VSAARFRPGQAIHIVGIGGFGMSAIARVLLQRGYQVSGSDRAANPITEALTQAGARIAIGHRAENVQGAEMVLATSAVPDEHVELAAATQAGIPVYRRMDVMAEIMQGQQTLAVSGTHGKTTTTAMITHILLENGQDPSYIVGGVMANTGVNAQSGQGPAFVIEADEYGKMFLGLRPQVAVVTSVEYDHPDAFATHQDLIDTFAEFIALLPADGLLVCGVDDPTAAAFAQQRRHAGLPVVTYALDNAQADWRVGNLRVDAETQASLFDVWRHGEQLGTVHLPHPGQHNALNALAALIVADQQGVDFAQAAEALSDFQGTGRRFEVRGTLGGVTVIDDYAHHPSAIRLTLDAARQRYPNAALWAVWQPHTYSRTHRLMDDYLGAFTQADHVFVTEIYAARETPLPGVTGAEIVAAMAHPDARFTGSLQATADALIESVQAPAVVVIMSAGDAPQVGIDYLAKQEGRLGHADAGLTKTSG
jgi:UDP-N-acetylmuramate--alanine ligase